MGEKKIQNKTYDEKNLREINRKKKYIRNISNIKYNNNNHHHQQQQKNLVLLVFFLIFCCFFQLLISFLWLFMLWTLYFFRTASRSFFLHISNSSLPSHVHLKRNAGKKEPTYTSILPVLIEFHKLNCILVEKSKREEWALHYHVLWCWIEGNGGIVRNK